jgi:hypothetical protein
MLLTRLARALNAESALLIRASLVVKIFVWSDVGTFFLQAAGGGLSSSEGSADLGHKVSEICLDTFFLAKTDLSPSCNLSDCARRYRPSARFILSLLNSLDLLRITSVSPIFPLVLAKE